MGLLDFLRRKRPADATGSTTTDSGTMAAATGAAAISPEGNVPPAEHGGAGHDPGAGGSDTGAAGYDSGGGFEGGGDSGGGGGDSGGGGGD
jgi:hypothetical protein